MPTDTSYIANLNSLVILNSAFFAIAQYAENRQAAKIKELQTEVLETDLGQLEGTTNVALGKVKNLWDEIVNESPMTNYTLILTYMTTYVLCATTLLLMQIPSPMYYLLPSWIGMLSFLVFFSSIWLMSKLWSMHQQLSVIKNKKASFFVQHTVWEETCIVNGINLKSPPSNLSK